MDILGNLMLAFCKAICMLLKMMTKDSKEIENEVKELKERAEKIKERFDGNARRPVVIEFAGMPKAGKTTIVNETHRFLKRCGFRTKVIVEKASICPVRDKKDASFNIWTMCQTVCELLVDTQSPPHANDPEVVIIDRGVFDAVCWLRLLERLKRLRSEEQPVIERFILLSEWSKRVSKVFVLTVDPMEALRREEGLLPIKVEGSIMNHEVLSQTRENVLRCIHDFESQFDISSIDTTKNSASLIALKVVDQALDTIDSHLHEKILNVPSDSIRKVFGNRTSLLRTEAAPVVELFGKLGRYEARPIVEADQNLIQALPVLVVRNAKGDILRLKRKERDKSNLLHEKLVLWAGGHVREEDGQNGKAIARCLLREAKEELKLNVGESEVQFLGAIWEPHATPKTAQHVALVYEWRAQTDDVEVCLSNAEFYERKGTSLHGKFVPLTELSQKTDYEPWSSAILNDLLGVEVKNMQKRLI